MRRSVFHMCVGVCVLLVTTGCGAGSGISGAAGGSSSSGAVLTNQDIMDTHEADLYRAVQRLRPNWLRPRGQTSTTQTAVVTLFVDGIPQGGVGNLVQIPLESVVAVRFYSANEAGFRFGTLAGNSGTVEVSLRR
jgi:hypothetical protein